MAAAVLAQFALLLCVLAAAVLVAGIGATFPRVAARCARRPARPPRTVRRPIQVVAADLRRLARQLALVPAGAPAVRRQALLAAYDDVLVEVAGQLEVPHRLAAVPRGPARDAERQRLLTALEDAGLAVHA
jgi:hypothetical protein